MQQKQGRKPGRKPTKKAKIPQPNRNKYKNIQSTQTIYESSSQSQSQSQNDPQLSQSVKSIDQKLSLHYKPQKIIGRQKQKKMIHQFINASLIKDITNRCLCKFIPKLDISGCPGLGKTVTVMEIIKDIAKNINPKKASFQLINCLELKQPARIYKQLLLKSKRKLQSAKKKPHYLAIEFDKFIRLTKTHFLFVIDEVDFLYTKNQNVLYNLVEWCSQSTCNFSIVMIANTMDFPEKLAPKITSRMGSWRMCFKPYMSGEIKKIIQQRLEVIEIFEPKAIDFAVKKFSMYTSDLRKIFNIVKEVIESRKGKKKISIEDLSIVWNRLAEEEQISWKEELPQIYTTVIDFIKKDGGKSHSFRLFECLIQKKLSSNEVNMILLDLSEMEIVKLSPKAQRGVRGWSVTLIDGNF